jgi:phosphoenolpyruvate carboxylase
MREAGMSFEALWDALTRIHVTPVFTAHPTEVARRTVIWKRQRVAQLLQDLDELPLTDDHAAKVEREIAAEITALWQTDEVRRASPTVSDEIQMGLDYSTVLFERFLNSTKRSFRRLRRSMEFVWNADGFPASSSSDPGSEATATETQMLPPVDRIRASPRKETVLAYYVQSVRTLRRRLKLVTKANRYLRTTRCAP